MRIRSLVLVWLLFMSCKLFSQDTITLDPVNVAADRYAVEQLNPLVMKKVDSLMHASAGLTHDVTQTTYRTVIDLRDTGDVKVNILTTLATPRTLNLAESGVPFAQAKEQAESDVLHSLGIYEAVAPFDSVDFSQKSNSVFPVFVMVSYLFGGSPKAVEVAADAIGKHGTWGEVVSLENVVTRTLERDFRLLRESEFLGKLGIGPDDMQIAEQVEKYYFNAIAVNAFQKDRCTADNQGEEESGIMPVINTMKNESWNGVSRDEKNRESVNDSNYSDTDGRHCRLCPDAERNP